MKKIGFVTSPLASGHAARGIGFYTRNLLSELKKQSLEHQIEIVEINDTSNLSNNLDLVHYPFFDLFSHTLPIFRNTKTIVTIHDVIYLEFPDHYPSGLRGWGNLQLQKMALSSVARVITDSYASVQAIRKFLNVPHEKIKLVYLAAESRFIPIKNKKTLLDIKRKYNLPDKFVLYVGDVNYNKNIPGLIKSCNQANIPLVIVGKQANEIDKLDLSHPELKHLNGIDWSNSLRLGFVSDEDVVAIYNLATVYCQASFSEGFGLPVLEALACGTPVACSNTHSLPEIAGDSATYFDPFNVSSIVTALKTAKNKSGVDQAAKFSWAKTASDTLNVYKELI